MKTKLTLSVDPELAAYAHAEAKRTGKSVSAMFSESMRRRASGKSKKYLVDEMVGSLVGYDIDDSKEGIRRAYAEKHLRSRVPMPVEKIRELVGAPAYDQPLTNSERENLKARGLL